MSEQEPNRLYLEYERARVVKEKYEDVIMAKPNVVGLGIGNRHQAGLATGEIVVVVMVRQKVKMSNLALDEMIPDELDGVPVDVQITGRISINRGER